MTVRRGREARAPDDLHLWPWCHALPRMEPHAVDSGIALRRLQVASSFKARASLGIRMGTIWAS